MAPGKPVTLAVVSDKPVFGMPGPSIASLTVLRELVSPLLTQWGVPIPPDTYLKGELTEPIESVDCFDMFFMMRVHKDNGKILISPVERIFGQMMGVRADAVLHKTAGSDALTQGKVVTVRMLRRGFPA